MQQNFGKSSIVSANSRAQLVLQLNLKLSQGFAAVLKLQSVSPTSPIPKASGFGKPTGAASW